MREGGEEGGGLGECGGQGVLSSLPPRWVSFYPVKQPRLVGRGGDGSGVWGVRGGGRHGRAQVPPPPSPLRVAGTRGMLSPCPTGGGKRKGRGGQFVRGLGQLCHLLGVLSGRGEGRALFGAAGGADSRGAGRGRTPSPSACAPPRASLHVALGAVGSEPCRSPAALRAAHQGAQRLPEEGAGENFPGWLWAGSEAERAGRAALLARSAHTRTHCLQRAPPRFARESASLRLL